MDGDRCDLLGHQLLADVLPEIYHSIMICVNVFKMRQSKFLILYYLIQFEAFLITKVQYEWGETITRGPFGPRNSVGHKDK